MTLQLDDVNKNKLIELIELNIPARLKKLEDNLAAIDLHQKQFEIQKEINEELEQRVKNLEKELEDAKDEHQRKLSTLQQRLEDVPTKEELAAHEKALKKLANICAEYEEKIINLENLDEQLEKLQSNFITNSYRKISTYRRSGYYEIELASNEQNTPKRHWTVDEKGVLFCSVSDEKEAAQFAIVDNLDQDETKSLIYIDSTDPYGVKGMPPRYVAVSTDETLCRF